MYDIHTHTSTVATPAVNVTVAMWTMWCVGCGMMRWGVEWYITIPSLSMRDNQRVQRALSRLVTSKWSQVVTAKGTHTHYDCGLSHHKQWTTGLKLSTAFLTENAHMESIHHMHTSMNTLITCRIYWILVECSVGVSRALTHAKRDSLMP